jgi:putative transposase
VVGVGLPPRSSTRKGTALPKDTHPTPPAAADTELVLPEQVTIALGELAGAARDGLLALAVGAGIQVLHALLAADVDQLVGPRGRHNPARTAVRHGTQPGQVTLGGRRIRVDRPRVRAADGAGEVPLPTWQAFTGTELLDRLTLERMLAKLSTRRYPAGLEPVGTQVEQAAVGTSRSAVSRRFVAATEHALADLLARDLAGLDLVALMVDGVRVAEHTCVVALGITGDGTKVPLGLAEGATENATVVCDLLAGLRDRGLEVTRPILVVIDGAKALRRAVADVFDHPVIQRCLVHRSRKVSTCRFLASGLVGWHGHYGGGSRAARVPLRGAAGPSERAAAAADAGHRGAAAWARRCSCGGRHRWGQRDHRASGRG